MKKEIFLISSVLFLLFLSGCENGLSREENPDNVNVSTKVNKNKNRSGKGGFDLTPYIDASLRNVNAADISVYDFEELCGKTYSCKGSDITVNVKEHTISVRCPKVTVRNKEYSNLYAKYEYKFLAAGEDLLYLCPLNNDTAQLYTGDRKLNVKDISPFLLYISFYGFGQSRIEVSSFLNGESMITGGTYWAK